MYSQSWSPGWRTIIFLDGSSSRVPSALTMNACARAPGAPPSRPHGDDPKRSPRWETMTSVVVASKTFSRPRPPRKRPAPPESAHSRARDAQREVHLDRLDRDVHAVRDVGLDDVDAILVRAGAHAAGGQLAGHERASGLGVVAAERHHQQRARARRRHLAGQRADQRAEDRVGDPLDGGRPAAHRRRRSRIDDRPLGQHRVHRAEAAAVVRDGGVGDRAHRVVHRPTSSRPAPS